MEHQYAVIMAGGTGTRLWPLSRAAYPKQFLHLVGDVSLLQATAQNIIQVIPAERVFVMADAQKTALAKTQLPELPAANFMVEPGPRDNGPAIAIATTIIYARDPDAVIGVFWSDHDVQKPERFAKAIKAAYTAAGEHPDHIVSMGIKPTYPATEFGYIKMGHEMTTTASEPAFTVEQFKEKPDLATAQEYIRDWRYLWKTGYKVYRAKLMLDLFAHHQPEFYHTLTKIQQAMANGTPWDESFAQLEKKDIERLITEKIENLLVIPADLGWSDIGAWNTLHDVLASKNGSDMVVQTEGEHVGINNQHCLIIGKKKLIATIGLADIVIVETDDALLVAHKSAAQEVKKLIEELKNSGKNEYL